MWLPIVDSLPDDLSRDVYCLLGIPVDNVGITETVRRMEIAVRSRTPFLIATPNINFLVNSALDEGFRETVVFSDLCLPDGAWLVWLGRLIGVPIADRVAGADILEALKRGRDEDEPIRVFMFGGPDGGAERARRAINSRPDGLHCVGAANPGFGSLDQMSTDRNFDAINSSGADFLLVALGAKKGQKWLHENHRRLSVPVRAHLGAAMNFYSRAIKRAPEGLQRWGFEWAWRIKEEPELWRRYAYDAWYILGSFFSGILPLIVWTWYLKLRSLTVGQELDLTEVSNLGECVIALKGSLTTRNVERIAARLRAAVAAREEVVLDLSGARAVDGRFAGLLLMLEKTLRREGRKPRIVGAPMLIEAILRLYGITIERAAHVSVVDRANPIGAASSE